MTDVLVCFDLMGEGVIFFYCFLSFCSIIVLSVLYKERYFSFIVEVTDKQTNQGQPCIGGLTVIESQRNGSCARGIAGMCRCIILL